MGSDYGSGGDCERFVLMHDCLVVSYYMIQGVIFSIKQFCDACTYFNLRVASSIINVLYFPVHRRNRNHFILLVFVHCHT